MAPVFLQKENNGCEYNHDIPGVTPSRLVFLFFLSVLHFVIFFKEPGRRILANANPPDEDCQKVVTFHMKSLILREETLNCT